MAMQTIPYRVNSDDAIRVYVYVDSRTGRVLHDHCLFVQGTEPCTGDPAAPCRGQFGRCNAPNKTICMDEVGRLQVSGLPEWVQKEWIDFAKVSWEVKEHIDFATIKPHPTDPAMMVRDRRMERSMRLQFLLKDWSLKRFGEEESLFKIKRRQASNMAAGTQELAPDTFNFIKSSIDPDFIDQILRAHDIKLSEIVDAVEEHAIEEIKEATGITANLA